DEGGSGRGVRFGEAGVARHGRPRKSRHRIARELVEEDALATDVEQVERRPLHRLEHAKIEGPLEAPAFLRRHEGLGSDVGRIEEPVCARLYARARVGGARIGYSDLRL